MSFQDLDKLASVIQNHREPLLARWREDVKQLASAKHLDTPTLNDHVPDLLDELATALRSHSDRTVPETLRQGSPPAHGLQRVKDGFDIAEVVAEYSILRCCIHDLADSNGLTLQGEPFHIFNRVLDGAIGLAVQTYATQRALEVQKRREEYLAFVSHDLRTPLNAIGMSARVLEALTKSNADPETPRMFKAMHRNVRYLEELVRKILNENANLETEVGLKLERRVFDLWPLVEVLIHNLRPIAGTASTQLLNQIPDDLIVYADADLMTRVFQNLIANAIKYTPHGEVVIGATAVDDEGAVECWVRDNGSGIPTEILDRIFEKGETGPHNDGGVGLGLAIVKTFTEAHGGTVTVESKERVGTTFRLSLPGREKSETEA